MILKVDHFDLQTANVIEEFPWVIIACLCTKSGQDLAKMLTIQWRSIKALDW